MLAHFGGAYTTNNFKNVVDSTLSVNENEWKERCKLYNERLRKGI